MNGLASYKLTIVAAVIVLCIAAGVVAIIGTSSASIMYLAFVGPTIVALLAVLRVEQNAKENGERHRENVAQISAIRDGQQTIAKEALQTLRESHMSIEDAAIVAAQVVAQLEAKHTTS